MGRYRLFWFSLGISLFVLLVGAGFVLVDYQGRRLTFGDGQPPIQVEHLEEGQALLEVKLLGVEGSWDITPLDRFFDFFCDFCCIPHQ